MLVYSNRPGVVGVFEADAVPFSLYMLDIFGINPWAYGRVFKAALMGFDYGSKSGFSVNHTMRQRIYYYIIGGERAGVCRMTGMWFGGTCTSSNGPTGFDNVLAYYEAVRVTTTGLPVIISMGPATSLYGYMHEFTAKVDDPQLGVGSFAFNLTTIPRGLIYPGPSAAIVSQSNDLPASTYYGGDTIGFLTALGESRKRAREPNFAYPPGSQFNQDDGVIGGAGDGPSPTAYA